MQIEKLNNWRKGENKPFVLAGPCSAETEEQLLETTKGVIAAGVNVVRAGVWKPRTRPNNFEGIGEDALKWISNIRKEVPSNTQFAVEVATTEHVELALKYGIDILWIGARSTVNPFTVQAIADSLKGVDVPVLVKNPINPDLGLWIGALERFNQAGITKLGAIHRGFSSHKEKKYRNTPMWQMALALKKQYPDLPMISDPSHITGNRDMIFDVCQKALDLDFDGLMIETHRDPANAWSDAAQQVTPDSLKDILSRLKVREVSSSNPEFNTHLAQIREGIDQLDREIFEVLAERMKAVEEIGRYKKENDVTVFQVNRWNEIMRTRAEWAEELGLSKEFMEEVFTQIHDASIRRQTQIMLAKEAKEV